jgi:23S rRNA (pseudouridine1915-N3)-methyltransferase
VQLHILAVGQRMPSWVEAAFDEYTRRMPPEMRVVLRELKAEPRSASRTAEAVMAIECERIEAALPKGALLVVLDERGRDLSTVMLAEHMKAWRSEGRDVAFVIGGADGLAPAIKSRAGLAIRLSSLTLPHGMARVVLAEALYRAFTVLSGHPYHRV